MLGNKHDKVVLWYWFREVIALNIFALHICKSCYQLFGFNTFSNDFHIHIPQGAVPKDGPSAGVTMTTSLVSALSGIPVRHDVAMTGEITLTGRVLAIGGLREKSTAAYTMGIRTLLVPRDNMRDIPELDPIVSAEMTFIPCETLNDVLSNALVKQNTDAVSFSAQQETESGKSADTSVVIPPQNERIYGTV